MSSKKIILLSVFLFIIFFVAGWILSPYILSKVFGHFKSLSTENIRIVDHRMNSQFKIHLLTTLSVAVVPLLMVVVALCIRQFRKRSLTGWDYFFYTCILLVASFFGSFCRFHAIRHTLQMAREDILTPAVVSTLNVEQMALYKWAYYCLLITSFLMIILGKRKTISKS